MNGDEMLSDSVTPVFRNVMSRYGMAETFHNLSFPIIHAINTESKEYQYIPHTTRQRKGLDPGKPEPVWLWFWYFWRGISGEVFW